MATAKRSDAARIAVRSGIAPSLLDWFEDHARPLPWRSDRDPYRIWISEILLQQTRVRAALPYYLRFLDRFPTLQALARATPTDVLSVWAGAGYYARAWHLLEAARILVDESGGSFPTSVEALERLPGVGPYTARAIAALAFDVPVIALEANGRRIAARLLLERGDVHRPEIQRRLESALASWMPVDRPGKYLEALMELGETICTTRRPSCGQCPLQVRCRAFRELDAPDAIPVPRRPRRIPHHRAAVVALTRNGSLLLQLRQAPGLLHGLWELPGGHPEAGESMLRTARRELWEETGIRASRLRPMGIVQHSYSHFSVELHVFQGAAQGRGARRRRGLRWVPVRELESVPKPRATEKAIGRLRLPIRTDAVATARTRRG